jgi:hypothetical protein
MLDQKILLEGICKKPQLIDHYPHTREHLEKTRLDSTGELRRDTKAAVEAYGYR